jgi:hypothetical protein
MKVGDYVRTKYGEICKLKKSRFKDLVYETDIEIDRHNDRDSNDYGFDSNTIQDIIKSSPNIIDLIEVGDYVNGNRVIEIDNKSKDIFNKYLLVEETDYDNCNISYSNNDIKSIVTKEMFTNAEYRVKTD